MQLQIISNAPLLLRFYANIGFFVVNNSPSRKSHKNRRLPTQNASFT